MIRETILKFFLSEYRNSSFITKEKISLLFWSHCIFIPVAVCYLIINIFRDYPSELTDIYIIDSFFIVSLITGLILIKKGKFSIAVDLDIVVMTFLTIWGHYARRPVQTETGYNGFASLIFGVIAFTALFSSRRRLLSLISFLFLAMTISFYFYSANKVSPSTYTNLLSNTLTNIMMIILVFSLSYNNRTITDKSLETAQHELKINTELSRSLEQKVHNRTLKLAEERETLNIRNHELEETKNILTQKNNELEIARQSAEKANKAKNSFLADLSHEIRTPLNGIIGISSLMLDRNLSEENNRPLRMIKQSGENLFFIIQDLLDFTIIENNQITIKNSFFNSNDMVENITMALTDQINNKNLIFKTSITPANALVYSDKTRLTQIIMNLVTNSIKYTRSGSIELSMIINNVITIKVSDTGIGIEKEKINSIFEAFSRIDSDYVKSQSGLGLGLSIVSRIITMMKGSITAESEPGNGSTFTVIIPLEKGVKQNNKVESDSEENYKIISGKKILVVEDDAINRFYFNTLLIKAGALADDASNGKEALSLVESVKYDIILMDLNMPDFDGLMLTRMIRNTDNPNRCTLIAALSAHAYRDYIEKCIDAGMNEFISKPVEREPFLGLLSTMIKTQIS